MGHTIRKKLRTSEEALGTLGPRNTTLVKGGWGSSGNGEHLFFIAGGLCLKRVTGHLLVKMVRWRNAAPIA